MTDRPFDPYDILQVARHAEPDVIQAAYRTLARRLHPDRSDDPAAHYRMAQLNRAWEILGDATQRAHYDEAAATPPVVAGAASPSQAPAGSTWDIVRDGEGAAGPPPGRPSGTVLEFGRFKGWSMGEIARIDPGYLEWLESQLRGQRFRQEIDLTLRKTGFRTSSGGAPEGPRRWR